MEDLGSNIIGYDFPSISQEEVDYNSKYACYLLKSMIKISLRINFILYSKHKNKEISLFSKELKGSNLRFLKQHSPKRLFADGKLSLFHSFGDFVVDKKKVKRVLSIVYSIPDDVGVSSKYIKWLEKFERIICPSNVAAKRLAEYLPERISDINVILPGIGLKSPKIDNTQALQSVFGKYGIGSDYFLYMDEGAANNKNVRNLIEAYIKFWNRSQTIPSLVIVSGGGEIVFGGLEREASLLKSKNKLMIIDKIGDEELATIYSRARLFIFMPHKRQNIYSPEIIDAMANGVPIICSDEGFGSEITHNAARFIIPYDVDDICSALESLESNLGYRQSLVEGAKKFVSNYNWDTAAQKTLEVYKELV